MGRRHQQRHVSADQFCRVVVEQSAGSPVGTLDDATVVDRQDAVHGGIQNGLNARLALAQASSACLRCTDIPDDTGEIPCALSGYLAHGQFYREDGAIPPQRLKLAPDPDNPRLTRPEIACDIFVVLRPWAGGMSIETFWPTNSIAAAHPKILLMAGLAL